MKQNKLLWIVGLVMVSMLAIAVTGTVLAQEGEPTAPAPGTFARRGGMHGFGRGFGQAGMEAAAGVLGMTADELSTQLWGGKTLADLAEEAGVDLQDVRDAVEAANQAAMRDAIEQAVEDGLMSQEQADWLLEGLDKGFLGGRGFGCFGGRGGFGGFKGFRGGGMFGGGQSAPAQPAPMSF